MYVAREFVEDWGLMSYGASLPNLFRRAASLQDPQGSQSGRPPGGSADKAEARLQSENGGRTGARYPSRIPDVGRRGIRVNGAMFVHGGCVIGGPGSFVVSTKDRDKFKGAIRTKLILEVAGRTPERRSSFACITRLEAIRADG
jgi:Protein of unknown function (DUF1194)